MRDLAVLFVKEQKDKEDKKKKEASDKKRGGDAESSNGTHRQ